MSTDLFLYANGDSFVEGCELGDFLLPDYPGAYNFNESIDGLARKSVREWFENIHKPETDLWHTRHKLIQQIKHQEQQRNFITKLAKLLSAKFYNNALGGCGMDRIVRTTISDLIEFKKTRKNIIAVIGTAEPLRIELPSKNAEPPLWELYHPGNSVPDSILNTVVGFHYVYTKNYHKMVGFYQRVIAIQDFCKANGIKLLWVSGNAPIVDVIRVEPEYSTQRDLCALSDYANFKPHVDMEQVARQIHYQVRLPGYHFSESVHEETAKQLYEHIQGL
jgi:hypothetical protein